MCEHHQDQPKELFCKDCLTQICVNCKVNGSHSVIISKINFFKKCFLIVFFKEEPYKDHTLIAVQDCYKLLKKTKNEKSAQTSNLSKKIKQHLKIINKKVLKMKEGFRFLENSIKKEFEKLMQRFEKLKYKSLAPLESIKLLMENRFNELKWMEYFIKFQFDYTEPGAYVEKFFTHQRMQQALYSNMVFPTEKEYKKHGDYALFGGYEIIDMKAKRRREAEEKLNREVLRKRKEK